MEKIVKKIGELYDDSFSLWTLVGDDHIGVNTLAKVKRATVKQVDTCIELLKMMDEDCTLLTSLANTLAEYRKVNGFRKVS